MSALRPISCQFQKFPLHKGGLHIDLQEAIFAGAEYRVLIELLNKAGDDLPATGLGGVIRRPPGGGVLGFSQGPLDPLP